MAQPSFGLSLEDMFVSRGRLDDKAARSDGWKKLPIREGEREHFDHSADGAAQILAGTLNALDARARRRTKLNASTLRDARLFVLPEGGSVDSFPGGSLPAGIVSAQEHCFTSDLQGALATETIAIPKTHIEDDRNEARFLASVESRGKWFAISKVILALITSQGEDALIADVPAAAIEVLRLTCPGLLMLPSGSTPPGSDRQSISTT